MKLTDDLIKKYGVDKILHFLGGGYITALFALFGWIGLIIGVVVTLVLSLLKEYKFDSVPDNGDIKFAMYGSGLSVIFYLLALLI